MRFTIRSIFCAAFILFMFLLPSAMGSWIMQSMSQGINGMGTSNGLQNGLQMAGTSNDNVFIVQHIIQEAGLNDPDLREILFVNGDYETVGESNIPEDLNKFVEELRSRDEDFGVVFCIMDFPLIMDDFEEVPDEPPEEPKEIEDDNFFGYIIILIDGKYDFGDAPDGYDTMLASNGARHIITPGLYLGQKNDADIDGRPAMDADGDDINETDDEDGVVIDGALLPGKKAVVDVTASSPGYLNSWIDFNGDGDWTDEGEKISSDRRIEKGKNHIEFNVPAGSLEGKTYARFRFSSTGGLSFTGPAPDGEVEDHRVLIGE